MTSRSNLLSCLTVLAGALVFIVVGAARPAHGGDGDGDDPPECLNDWPNPNSCFPDILCDEYADFWDVRRAIVHIYGPDIAGTGVLINNANCADFGQDCGVPYLLTAYHVGSGVMGKEMTKGQENTLENEGIFTLGFEAAWCGGPVAGGAIAVQGASIIARSVEKDILLLKLATKLPDGFSAYYVGWGEGTLDEHGNLDEQAVAIGHPCGAPKRIAISEPGAAKFKKVVDKNIYEVEQWEIGALAAGSSGSPLLDMNTGSLHGVFTDAWGAGPRICFHPDDPNWKAHDHFTELSSILDVLPQSIDGWNSSIDAYDPNPESLIDGTVEDANYYGKGVKKTIWAKEQVLLINGFYADKGSEINIGVKP